MKSIILVGAFVEAVELCELAGYEIKGIIDSIPETEMYGYPIIGDDATVLANPEPYLEYGLVLVPDAPSVRKKLYQKYKEKGFQFETIISPKAMVSKSAIIAEGCLIQSGCNISAMVQLGTCTRVNTNANIMHESIIADFCTIAPNSVLLGRCVLEEGVYLGANATILPEKQVAKNSIVGAAAVVTKDVSEGIVVIGNPARKLRDR